MQDFTAAVNGGPAVLFINFLPADHQCGERQRRCDAASAGGQQGFGTSRDGRRAVLPACDTDRLIVQTPGLPAASPNVIYTPDPSASDGGTLNLASIDSPVTINGIETY